MSAEDLAIAVKNRRAELRLAQLDLRDRGGPHVATVRNIEQGQKPVYRPMTLRQMDRALEWVGGSAQALLETGAPPRPVAPPQPSEGRVATTDDQLALRIGRVVLAMMRELS